jgi:hypothetical protein
VTQQGRNIYECVTIDVKTLFVHLLSINLISIRIIQAQILSMRLKHALIDVPRNSYYISSYKLLYNKIYVA